MCARGVDSSGDAYVIDTFNNRVEKFTSTGTPLLAWGCPLAFTAACPAGSGPGQFDTPQGGVAVDSVGNVYVTDFDNNRVEKFTSTGTFLLAWSCCGSGKFNGPFGVAVDSLGNVYVAGGNNNLVEKFTGAGTFLLAWGSSGSGAGQFVVAYSVGVDSSGNVYVVDEGNNRVQKFGDPITTTTTGTTATTFAPVHQTPVGGVMLSSVGFSVLPPWAVVLFVLGVVSVEAFLVKRRTKRR